MCGLTSKLSKRLRRQEAMKVRVDLTMFDSPVRAPRAAAGSIDVCARPIEGEVFP